MDSENIIAINVPNIITVGLMFFAFVLVLQLILSLVKGRTSAPEASADA